MGPHIFSTKPCKLWVHTIERVSSKRRRHPVIWARTLHKRYLRFRLEASGRNSQLLWNSNEPKFHQGRGPEFSSHDPLEVARHKQSKVLLLPLRGRRVAEVMDFASPVELMWWFLWMLGLNYLVAREWPCEVFDFKPKPANAPCLGPHLEHRVRLNIHKRAHHTGFITKLEFRHQNIWVYTLACWLLHFWFWAISLTLFKHINFFLS